MVVSSSPRRQIAFRATDAADDAVSAVAFSVAVVFAMRSRPRQGNRVKESRDKPLKC